MSNFPDPQTLQIAIAAQSLPDRGFCPASFAASNAHTGLHQAIHQLKYGSTTEAKQLLS